jgi:hypothetical protein
MKAYPKAAWGALGGVVYPLAVADEASGLNAMAWWHEGTTYVATSIGEFARSAPNSYVDQIVPETWHEAAVDALQFGLENSPTLIGGFGRRKGARPVRGGHPTAKSPADAIPGVVERPSARAAPRASSHRLARALEDAGQVRPPNSETHHIVAGSAKGAAPARATLERFGVDIDGASNGVFLPEDRAAASGGSAAAHSSVHTARYYNAVNEALSQATTKQEAIEVLWSIRQGLLDGSFP